MTDDRPILLAVPTRGYPWYETAQVLAPWKPNYVREKLSVANARNKICRDFLQTRAEILVMCDDDVVPGPDFMTTLLETSDAAPYDIVAAAVPIAKMPAHPVFINAFDVTEDGAIRTTPLPPTGHKKVDSVGSGLILIHRRVLEHPDMTRPFDQMIDRDGVILVGQDLEFCRRAREAGFRIGVSMDACCDHFVSLHANAVAAAYAQAHAEDLAEALAASPS